MAIEISRFRGIERVETIGVDHDQKGVLTLSPGSDRPFMISVVGIDSRKNPFAVVGYYESDSLDPNDNAIGPRTYTSLGIAEPGSPVMYVDAVSDEAVIVSFS